MFSIHGRLALLAFACAVASTASAQLPMRKELTYAVAKTIAEGSIEACAGRGYHVSAVVVDRAGQTIAALRGDGSGPGLRVQVNGLWIEDIEEKFGCP